MTCRNLRALENHANCTSMSRGWFQRDEFGHNKQLKKEEERASTCYRIDDHRIEAEIKERQRQEYLALKNLRQFKFSVRHPKKSKSKPRKTSDSKSNKNKMGLRRKRSRRYRRY